MEGASEGAAEVIAAIAHDLQRQLSGMATFDLVYGVGKVADLTVEPANQSASPLSVVGVGTGFAISLKQVFDRSTTAREDANDSTRHQRYGRGPNSCTETIWDFQKSLSRLPIEPRFALTARGTLSGEQTAAHVPGPTARPFHRGNGSRSAAGSRTRKSPSVDVSV